jgi:hypothetical protein
MNESIVHLSVEYLRYTEFYKHAFVDTSVSTLVDM